jgi:hypothetical protein
MQAIVFLSVVGVSYQAGLVGDVLDIVKEFEGFMKKWVKKALFSLVLGFVRLTFLLSTIRNLLNLIQHYRVL